MMVAKYMRNLIRSSEKARVWHTHSDTVKIRFPNERDAANFCRALTALQMESKPSEKRSNGRRLPAGTPTSPGSS